MPKIWTLLPQHSPDIIQQLLFNRGLKTKKKQEMFFNPKMDDYLSSINLNGIDQVKEKLTKYIQEKKLIVVYGDYDVDGVCASAIGYLGLTSLGAKVLPYIPHREKEGYGLSKIGIDWAKDQGAAVILTVDHGIVAFDQISYAKSLGLEVIVTDHHVASEKIPDIDVVHSTEICGAGVIWCVIRQMVEKDLADELLEFVAIATVADMMILTGVNRWFVKEGINKLKRTSRVGLKALANECNVILADLTAYHLSHIFGPRLNAMGRLEHALDSLRLLCTSSVIKATDLAKKLADTNAMKKQLTDDAIFQAKVMADQKIKSGDQKILVVHSTEWVPGIIGLVAARLAEEYRMPVIALAVGESQAKASARSHGGLNIVETIRQCTDLLIDVGGHPAAAGFTISNQNLDIFIERINLVVPGNKDEFIEEILIEKEIKSSDITRSLIDKLNEFEPFGLGNNKPIFSSELMVQEIRTVGEGKHLKLKLENIDAIGFGKGGLANLLTPGQVVKVAFYLELNKFNGSEKVQLNILDLYGF